MDAEYGERERLLREGTDGIQRFMGINWIITRRDDLVPGDESAVVADPFRQPIEATVSAHGMAMKFGLPTPGVPDKNGNVWTEEAVLALKKQIEGRGIPRFIIAHDAVDQGIAGVRHIIYDFFRARGEPMPRQVREAGPEPDEIVKTLHCSVGAYIGTPKSKDIFLEALRRTFGEDDQTVQARADKSGFDVDEPIIVDTSDK